MDIISLPEPKDRILFLDAEIDQESVNDISRSIIEINDNDERLIKLYSAYNLAYSPMPIKLYIDSYGGYVYQCLGLLGIIEKSKVPVDTYVTGCAMSCAFLISITGRKRYAYENSTFMYHQISGSSDGTVKDMDDELVEFKRLQAIVEKHVIIKTSVKLEKLINSYTKKTDWFIDAKKALKLNIIDEII